MAKKFMPFAQRLERIRLLREIGVPAWIVKWEQMTLCLNREGLKCQNPGKTFGKRQQELVDLHIKPLLGKE